MANVVFKRIAIGVPVVFGVTVVVFFVLRVLPGNPVNIITQGAPTTPGERHDLMVEFGLNKPVIDQFGLYLWHALHGDFGNSFQTRQPVLSAIGQQAMATVTLTLAAILLTVIVGISLGMLSALFADTWVDSTIRAVSLLGTSMPTICTGPILILLFSFTLRWFPATGSGSFSELVLPAVALAMVTSGYVIQMVRNSMLEVIGLEFVNALYAKGLAQRQVWVRHVLRNALLPTVTLVGVQLGVLLSSAVIVEQIFGRQGLGSLLVNGINTKDYPMVQAIVLIIAVAYVAVNVVVDISYAYLDPRVRTAMTRG
jgi:peptide/nickel transport system permease protein